MNEPREVRDIVLSEQEIRDMQRAYKLAIVAASKRKFPDYDFVLRLADLYRRLESFIWIMDRGV